MVSIHNYSEVMVNREKVLKSQVARNIRFGIIQHTFCAVTL